jgi:hypothetical protein
MHSLIHNLSKSSIAIHGKLFSRPTNKDEMCNFYIMYYVEEGEPLDQKYCFSRGPPFYYWNSELNNIPDKDASTLD